MEDKYPNIISAHPRSCIAGQILVCERITSKIYRKRLGRFGLTNSQTTTLLVVGKHGPMKQVLFSQMMFMEKSTVNRNIKRLLDAGLLTMNSNKTIEATTKGKDLLEQVIPIWEATINEINELLDPEGEAALRTLFTKLTQLS